MASSLLFRSASPLGALVAIPGSIGALTASQITPRLYLSDFVVASNWAALIHLGITHVVSVVEIPPITPPGIEHLHICIADLPICNISDHFKKTTEFIYKALSQEGTKVLVHCLGGLSRSASVVCAYLIAAKGCTAAEAIAYTHDCRRITHPNAGFRKQLRTYAESYGLPDGVDEEALPTQSQGGLSGLTGGLTGKLTGGYSLPRVKLLGSGSIRKMVKDSISGVVEGDSDVVKIAKVKVLGPDWQGSATIITHAYPGPNSTVNVDVTQMVQSQA
ncbi:hypothetical protein H072_10085 [Dactylellina haptotyla CBS 200.50]|uniref:Uncharacterized protein n=1 Tax=Dactylellina haptotyla (strain CBS 200.50) TaxID=1284197 RepID=S8A127_DACHA|nr:hypothetical protein H072_10085 [Dactylellina haptotyla CBS 200.50]